MEIRAAVSCRNPLSPLNPANSSTFEERSEFFALCRARLRQLARGCRPMSHRN